MNPDYYLITNEDEQIAVKQKYMWILHDIKKKKVSVCPLEWALTAEVDMRGETETRVKTQGETLQIIKWLNSTMLFVFLQSPPKKGKKKKKRENIYTHHHKMKMTVSDPLAVEHVGGLMWPRSCPR